MPMGTTYIAKPGEVQARWLVIDGTDKVLGRMATKIAMVLMGKHRPQYTPHVDTGDYVVVINAEKVRVSPETKERKRLITWHTYYFGGLKQVPVTVEHQRNPARVIELAVRRMLPKTKLGKAMFAKLKIYAGAEHPHSAQNPQPFPERI